MEKNIKYVKLLGKRVECTLTVGKIKVKKIET